MSPRALFRAVAIAEAITWALLLTGMLLKYVVDAGGWGVTIGGSLHGFVFLAYLVVAGLVAVNQRWSFGRLVLAGVAAIIPFATVPLELWLQRRGALEGGWRTTASDDPRDQRLPDRMLRVLLRRPRVLAAGAGLGVAAVFSALLVLE